MPVWLLAVDDLRMDMSIESLIASLFVSNIGFGLFLYGKKELRMPQLIAGVAMMGYPYFITEPVAMWGITVAIGLALILALRFGL